MRCETTDTRLVGRVVGLFTSKLLHEADDDAVIWLESTATAALAK